MRSLGSCAILVLVLGTLAAEGTETEIFSLDEFKACIDIAKGYVETTNSDDEAQNAAFADEVCQKVVRTLPTRARSNLQQERKLINLEKELVFVTKWKKLRAKSLAELSTQAPEVQEYAACLKEIHRMLEEVQNKTIDENNLGCGELRERATSSGSGSLAYLNKLKKEAMGELHFRIAASTLLRCMRLWVDTAKELGNTATRAERMAAIRNLGKTQNCDPMLLMWMGGDGGTRVRMLYPEIETLEDELSALDRRN